MNALNNDYTYKHLCKKQDHCANMVTYFGDILDPNQILKFKHRYRDIVMHKKMMEITRGDYENTFKDLIN